MKYLDYPSWRDLAISQNPLVITNKYHNPFSTLHLIFARSPLGKSRERGKKEKKENKIRWDQKSMYCRKKQKRKRDCVNQLGTNSYVMPYIIVTYNVLEFENTRHRWDTSDCQMVWADHEKQPALQNVHSTEESQSWCLAWGGLISNYGFS